MCTTTALLEMMARMGRGELGHGAWRRDAHEWIDREKAYAGTYHWTIVVCMLSCRNIPFHDLPNVMSPNAKGSFANVLGLPQYINSIRVNADNVERS